jgi:hypothetical protein
MKYARAVEHGPENYRYCQRSHTPEMGEIDTGHSGVPDRRVVQRFIFVGVLTFKKENTINIYVAT